MVELPCLIAGAPPPQGKPWRGEVGVGKGGHVYVDACYMVVEEPVVFGGTIPSQNGVDGGGCCGCFGFGVEREPEHGQIRVGWSCRGVRRAGWR